jgi:PAS domain S-box-containing protein
MVISFRGHETPTDVDPPRRQSEGTPGLLQALTRSDRLAELLPALHQQAVAAVGGRASLLFQFDPDGQALQATSAYGTDRLPSESWTPAESPVGEVFRDQRPVFVADVRSTAPMLAEALEAPGAVLVPLSCLIERIGILVIGSETAPSPAALEAASSVGHALALALDRARKARDADLHRDLRGLLQEFSRTVSSTLNLIPGLEAVCAGANRLFAADRTSVWLHDRRAREVILSASSDIAYASLGRRVATGDLLEPAAIALRRDRAELAPRQGAVDELVLVTVPLKGRRRALGTLVLEGVRLDPGGALDLLARTDEMGRQLSSAIENVLLLEDVLRSRRELENTFNSLADLVVVCNREGRVVHVNRSFGERIGQTRQSLIDRPLSEIVGSRTFELLARALEPVLDNEPARPAIEDIEDPVLQGTFSLSLTRLHGETGEPLGAVLVARDVTAQARLEAERVDLRNRLVQSEKLAALGQFVAGIAHELNNPLQGVLGHLELLRATGAFPKTLRRDVQQIYREADRAAKIVRNLLVFAGSRRLVRRRTSVNSTLARVLALRAPACRAADIEVIRHHEDGLPRVKGDPLLLQQALLNIFLNAEQAIGSEGRIETRTYFRPETRTVVVEITDAGPGIPNDVLPRIFEPFYTTKEVGKGTGLGLAIAYGIIQEHGGEILATNRPEGGAMFTVQLPVEPG